MIYKNKMTGRFDRLITNPILKYMDEYGLLKAVSKYDYDKPRVINRIVVSLFKGMPTRIIPIFNSGFSSIKYFNEL